jgi:FkbM family methyltransferase
VNIRDLLQQPRDLFEAFCRENARFAYLGEHRALARVLGKYLVYVDPLDTSVAPHLVFDGCWEPWVTLALSRCSGRGLAIDVGANQGYYTLLLADLFEGVEAFEPQRYLAQMVRESLRVNGLATKGVVNEVAVSDSMQLMHLYARDGDSNNRGSVRVQQESEGEHSVGTCMTVTLDQMFAETLGEMPVSFIKMDAEGLEHAIWRGAKSLIQRHQPTILMEFTPSAYPDPVEFLSEIQVWYPLREVDEAGGLRTVSPERLLGQREFTMLWLEKAT